MKKVISLISLSVIVVIFLFFIYQSFVFKFFVKDHQIIKITLRDNFFAPVKRELLVEVVKSKESLIQGLSNRENLSSQSGEKIDALLFIFPEKSIKYFWMKDMLFSIDICWLDDNRFLSCERSVALPESGQNLKTYSSQVSASLVLETEPNLLSDQELNTKLFFKW